jgi:hypothetical protein
MQRILGRVIIIFTDIGCVIRKFGDQWSTAHTNFRTDINQPQQLRNTATGDNVITVYSKPNCGTSTSHYYKPCQDPIKILTCNASSTCTAILFGRSATLFKL